MCTHIQFSVNIYFKIIGLTCAFLHHLKQNHHLKLCFLVFTCPVQFLALWRASFPRFACSLKTICDPPCFPHSLYGENTHITNKTYSKIWLLTRVTQLLFFPCIIILLNFRQHYRIMDEKMCEGGLMLGRDSLGRIVSCFTWVFIPHDWESRELSRHRS